VVILRDFVRVTRTFFATQMTSFFDFSTLSTNLSPQVQKHVSKVYSTLTTLILTATLGTMMDIYFSVGNWMVSVLGFGCLLWFHFTDEQRDYQKASLLLHGFVFCQGVSIGSFVDYVIDLNPYLIMQALGATAVLFGSFTLSVLSSPSRQFFYVTGLLSSGVSILLYLNIFQLFFRTQLGYQIELYLGLVVFSLFVVYDTQMMIRKAESGSRKVLLHSLELFMDIFGIFVRLLVILSKKEENKKKRERRRDD
jgi:Bax inhibitor 1